VQATRANAKTKAYPNVSSRLSGRVPLPLLAETFGTQGSHVINDED